MDSKSSEFDCLAPPLPPRKKRKWFPNLEVFQIMIIISRIYKILKIVGSSCSHTEKKVLFNCNILALFKRYFSRHFVR